MHLFGTYVLQVFHVFFSRVVYLQEALSEPTCAFAIVLSLLVVVFMWTQGIKMFAVLVEHFVAGVFCFVFFRVRGLTTAVTMSFVEKLRLCLRRDGDLYGPYVCQRA